MLSSVFL